MSLCMDCGAKYEEEHECQGCGKRIEYVRAMSPTEATAESPTG